ncbi:ribokinase [Salisediminibacterium selenitireducens]|uniref:Ribokinase n=1 Tax=Bacillus selenitireducens (strain ATCC 700615 / DSM 15326 / MLS10) TaxID=439292 RepID=D6XZP2_BACIE|nr:ribokinase [Salisediminibacterium selenitireducens]ADH98416.1 ribokinase [[Bacillus] selenitireducens MLS10]
MTKPVITVIGSINMDMVTEAERAPDQGETLMGTAFQMIPGGKGANQAVAAARLGARVSMIGAVGDDPFADVLTENLKREGVATAGVKRVSGVSSGVASIVLSEQDNRILVVPGANGRVDRALVDEEAERILASDLVIMQLEIPLDTVIYAAKLCKDNNIPVLLNPAPAHVLPDELLETCTWLTPNEMERKAMGDLPQAVLQKLIVTEGKAGACFFRNGMEKKVAGHTVDVVDTTGAGDTFNGALAVELAKGRTAEEAIRFANAAAALSVTKLGAQTGMPTEAQVTRFLST